MSEVISAPARTGSRIASTLTFRAGPAGLSLGPIPLLPAIVFLAATVLFMPKALFGGGLFAPLDILSTVSPWHNSVASAPHAVEAVQNDFVQSVPLLEAMKEILRSGNWPTWTPFIAGGEPVGALATSAFQDPFNLLLVILPSVWGLGAVMALRLLFSQAFFYLFLRRLGTSSPIATFGAVSYTFCGTQIALLGRINAYLILPMMLWATVRIMQRRGAGDVALLAISGALAWLAGFPAGFANAVAIVVLLAVFLAVGMSRRDGGPRGWIGPVAGRLGLVACGLALSAGLSAISLLPNERILETSGLVQQRLYNSADHLDPTDLIGSFSVGALGSLHQAALLIDNRPGHQGFGGVSVEVEAGVGAIVTLIMVGGALLALLGRIRLTRAQRAAYLFGLVTIVGGIILVYFRTPLLGLFYDLPLIGSNPANRLRIIVDIGFAITACLGIEGWRADLATRRGLEVDDPPPVVDGADAAVCTPTLRVASGLAVAALIALVAIVLGRYLGFIEQAIQSHPRHDLELELAVALVATVVVFVAFGWSAVRGRARVWLAPVVGLGLAALTYATTGYQIRYFMPTVSSHWLLPRTAGHDELDRLSAGRYRMLGSGLGTFYSNTSIAYRNLDLRGLSISSKNFRALVTSAIPNAYALDHFKVIYTPPKDPINWKSPVLDDLGVRYYVAGTSDAPLAVQRPGPAQTGLRTVARGRSVSTTIAADAGLAGVQVPMQMAAGSSCTGSLLRVSVAAPGGATLATASRPAVDAPPSGVVPADFSLPQAKVAGHRRLRVAVTVVPARSGAVAPCSVAIGTHHGRAAVSQLVARPGQPVVVSNRQAVFYERPHAHPIVWMTGKWQSASSAAQAQALAVAPSRTWRTPVPVAGAGAPSHASGGTVTDVHYVSDGFNVAERASGRELVATGFAEGNGNWTATVDGHPARLAAVDGGLLGVVVGAGSHTIRFRYTPPAFAEGAVLTGISVVIVAVLIVGAARGWPPPWRWRRLTVRRGGAASA